MGPRPAAQQVPREQGRAVPLNRAQIVGSWTKKRDCGCFKPPRFGVVCYVTIDSATGGRPTERGWQFFCKELESIAVLADPRVFENVRSRWLLSDADLAIFVVHCIFFFWDTLGRTSGKYRDELPNLNIRKSWTSAAVCFFLSDTAF